MCGVPRLSRYEQNVDTTVLVDKTTHGGKGLEFSDLKKIYSYY